MGRAAEELPHGQAGTAPPAALARLLEAAGIRFNGPSPWDIQVRDPATYHAMLAAGSLGLGESYVAGAWECERLDALFHRLMSVDLDVKLVGTARLRLWLAALRARLVNRQSRGRAFEVGERHYDIGNDVFEAMLDGELVYSCAWWQDARSLDEAQQAKLGMICRKLELSPGERLLDVGCGFGGLAAHAARHHGVEVTGVTVSREQQRLAEERCRGLPVRIELADYRDLRGRYDKAVSVGMFEHVGSRNYREFFRVMRRCLDPQGLFLLHTIGGHVTSRAIDAWIDRYIFPNGQIPSAAQVTRAAEGLFLLEDWHNFGPDYDRTLMAWHANFERAWPRLAGKYGERFHRMWRYYLLACAGFFRSRQGQLWQIVLSTRERAGGYRSWRPAATGA